MAAWTEILDSNLEPNAPVRSVDHIAMRDNPIAIAEGAPGAPRIAGQQGPAVQNAGVFDGTLGAEKFQTGTAERDWVLARTATASVGAVGTYSFLISLAGQVNPTGSGDTRPGSDLSYSNTAAVSDGSPSGTWRNMGGTVGGSGNSATLWLRIS